MRGLILLVEFIAITAPLTWLWMNGGQEAYMAFFKEAARPLLVALGVTSYPPSLVRDRFIGFVPFVALMLITPGLEWRKRIGGILISFPIIFVCQVALVYAVYTLVVAGGGWNAETKTSLFPFQVMFDAMPLLLWAVFAHEYLGGLLQRIMPPVEGAPPPPPASPPTPSSPPPHAEASPAPEDGDASEGEQDERS